MGADPDLHPEVTPRLVFPMISVASSHEAQAGCVFGSLWWVGQEGQAGGLGPWADLCWPLPSGAVYVLGSGLRAGNGASILQGSWVW